LDRGVRWKIDKDSVRELVTETLCEASVGVFTLSVRITEIPRDFLDRILQFVQRGFSTYKENEK
jgi:hypothetical protein